MSFSHGSLNPPRGIQFFQNAFAATEETPTFEEMPDDFDIFSAEDVVMAATHNTYFAFGVLSINTPITTVSTGMLGVTQNDVDRGAAYNVSELFLVVHPEKGCWVLILDTHPSVIEAGMNGYRNLLHHFESKGWVRDSIPAQLAAVLVDPDSGAWPSDVPVLAGADLENVIETLQTKVPTNANAEIMLPFLTELLDYGTWISVTNYGEDSQLPTRILQQNPYLIETTRAQPSMEVQQAGALMDEMFDFIAQLSTYAENPDVPENVRRTFAAAHKELDASLLAAEGSVRF